MNHIYTALRKNAGTSRNDQSLWIQWISVSILVGVAALILTLLFTLPIVYLIDYGFSSQGLRAVKTYFLTLIPRFPEWVIIYGKWWISNFNITSAGPKAIAGIILAFAPFLMFTFFTWSRLKKNPYENNPRNLARGRPAFDIDVKEMGLLDGWIMVLGWYNGIKIKDKLLMLKETLSTLVIAPPGTGKTTGVVIPTIFETNECSMVVNDVKPEICDMTSGYRSLHSFCFRLEWAATDKPEEGKFYPRWNPISPRSMPARGPQRDLYMDRLCNVVIEEPKGDADPHWTNKGRAALNGFIHFVCNKVEAGNYDGIPEQWFGEEPSLPMLLDWLTEAQLKASDEIDKLREEDPNAALFADPIRNFLMDSVREAREGNYDPRSVLELTQLANTPDKERGSILSTMDAGLTIFKNSAVRARTSKSDFSFDDIRGMKDPVSGKDMPLTVYLVVNQEDAKALSVITGLFVELLSAWLIAHKPGHVKPNGDVVGPFPVLFVLDEFPQMPKLRALLDGPAVGRGQKVSYLMIAQDLGQIQETYGNEATETLMGTTAAKVVFTLTNTKTSERFQQMIGDIQYLERSSYSKTEGASKSWNPFSVNVTMSWKTGSMMGAADFLNLPFGRQILLFQGWSQRPIFCDTPFYFKFPKYQKLVDPDNGGKYPAAAPMPEFLVEERLTEEGYIEIPVEEAEALTPAEVDAVRIEPAFDPVEAQNTQNPTNPNVDA